MFDETLILLVEHSMLNFLYLNMNHQICLLQNFLCLNFIMGFSPLAVNPCNLLCVVCKLCMYCYICIAFGVMLLFNVKRYQPHSLMFAGIEASCIKATLAAVHNNTAECFSLILLWTFIEISYKIFQYRISFSISYHIIFCTYLTTSYCCDINCWDDKICNKQML